MLSFFQKLYLGILALALSTYTVFACINDEYTSRSETLWGAHYSNAFEINLITAVLIILIQSYFMIRLFRLYNQNQTVKIEKFFTLFMLFLGGFLISGIILSGGMLELLFGMFLMFFLVYYIFIALYQIYLLIKKNVGSFNRRDLVFLGTLLLYFILICLVFLGLIGARGISIMTIMALTIIIIVYSIAIVPSYRYRIVTIILAMILLVQFIPLCIKYFEASTIKPPQYKNKNINNITWGSTR